MFALILAIVVATPAPSPIAAAPAASASPEPLKTIITVRSSTFCEQMANHLNSAISSALTNDQTLGTTILTLRSGDLAASDLSRQHEIHRLQDLADGIYRNYRAGLDEVGRLRDLAKNAQDPDEKVELKAAADALGGVLYRQHLLQRDLDGFVAYLYAADMQADTNRDTLTREFIGANEADFPYGDKTRTQPYLNILETMAQSSVHPYMYRTPDTDVALAVNASRDFSSRIPDVYHDEVAAGEHISLASDHC